MSKLTDKQETFCLAVVEGLNLSDAYRKAYLCKNATDASVNQMASTMMGNIKCISRVEFLRKPVIERMQYGLEQAMAEAAEAFAVSKLKEQGGAMVAAVQLRSKLNGLLIDRAEVRTGPLDGVEHEELKVINEAIRSLLAPGNLVTQSISGTRH